MRIGLLDVDAESRGKVTYPNLALCKLSAWHKAQGDTVEWIDTSIKDPLEMPYYDRAYLSRVFSEPYSHDYTDFICAGDIIRAGSGYAIKIENEREVYHKELDPPFRTKWNTSIPTTDYTRLHWRTEGTPTATPHADAPAGATFVISQECRAGKRISWVR